MGEEEKILTLHPTGKAGVNILLRRYILIRDYIISSLEELGSIEATELNDKAILDLQDSFDGKVIWYMVTVKLDLEARKIIERIPKTSPHQIRLRKK